MLDRGMTKIFTILCFVTQINNKSLKSKDENQIIKYSKNKKPSF